MTGLILITSFFTALTSFWPDTSYEPIHKEMIRLQLYIDPPPESLAADTCYHYEELLILNINKSGKVIDFSLNDHAPDWLKKDITRLNIIYRKNFIRLDSLVRMTGLKKCKIVFPLILESDDYPCGVAPKKRQIEENFFRYQSRNLKGYIVFMNQLRFIWSTRYIR